MILLGKPVVTASSPLNCIAVPLVSTTRLLVTFVPFPSLTYIASSNVQPAAEMSYIQLALITALPWAEIIAAPPEHPLVTPIWWILLPKARPPLPGDWNLIPELLLPPELPTISKSWNVT